MRTGAPAAAKTTRRRYKSLFTEAMRKMAAVSKAQGAVLNAKDELANAMYDMALFVQSEVSLVCVDRVMGFKGR